MRMLLRITGFVIVVALLAVFICFPVGAERDETDAVRLFLSAAEDEEGFVTLEITLDSRGGICALLCDLEYDPETLIYLSGGAVDEKMHLSVVDFGGELRFLLDSAQNSAPDGALLLLYFKRIGGKAPDFALKCRYDALCFDGNEIITAPTVAVCDPPPNGSSPPEASSPDTPDTKPRLLAFEQENGRLTLAVAADGFAAGVRLFFVDLGGGGEHFEACIAGVTGANGIFRGEYLLPTDKSYAVVVTPLGYGRSVKKGERAVVFLHVN